MKTLSVFLTIRTGHLKVSVKSWIISIKDAMPYNSYVIKSNRMSCPSLCCELIYATIKTVYLTKLQSTAMQPWAHWAVAQNCKFPTQQCCIGSWTSLCKCQGKGQGYSERLSPTNDYHRTLDSTQKITEWNLGKKLRQAAKQVQSQMVLENNKPVRANAGHLELLLQAKLLGLVWHHWILGGDYLLL